MERSSLYFTGPGEVEVKKENIKPPEGKNVLVENEVSAISLGTEMLFYKKELEENILIDEGIEELKKNFSYPFKYGYSCVGRVKETGEEVPEKWLGKLVFSFHPHETKFIAKTDDLFTVPEDIDPEEAIFLPSVETAINLLLDGGPLIGENVLVIGQGVVGLLITSLLNEMAVKSIVTSDRHQLKRKLSRKMGADLSVRAADNDKEFFADDGLPNRGADLAYEISGDSKALERAIRLTSFEGKIVVGSWYGNENPGIKLGTKFHRKRLKLISSQVSHINSEYSGRWDKTRRINLAWDYIKKLDLKQVITHRFSLEKAKKVYDLMDKNKGEVLQAVFKY